MSTEEIRVKAHQKASRLKLLNFNIDGKISEYSIQVSYIEHLEVPENHHVTVKEVWSLNSL